MNTLQHMFITSVKNTVCCRSVVIFFSQEAVFPHIQYRVTISAYADALIYFSIVIKGRSVAAMVLREEKKLR